jgi:tetratricopeptide (TPR) repeat protein
LSAIFMMLFFAIRWRKTWPLISLGILWFFVGHSLEAGPLPLELYFEHRNYLAMLGPLILLCSIVPILSKRLRGLLPLLIALIVTFEGFLLWQTAIPWGNEDRLMQIAVVEHPDSLRAQQYAANKYIINGNYSKALDVQESLAVRFPQYTSTRLSILNLRCILNALTVDDVDATMRFVVEGDYDLHILGYLRPLLNNAANGTCTSIGLADVHSLFDEVIHNPSMAKSSTLVGATHYHKGIAYRLVGDLDKALEQLDLAYLSNPEIDVRLQQVVWSLEFGNLKSAEDYLVLAKQHGKERLLRRNFRAADLNFLQQEIDRVRDLAATGP